MKNQASSAQEIAVTEKEFIELLVQSGKTVKEAALQAKFAKIAGSSTPIGDKMVSIKDELTEEEKGHREVVSDAKNLVDGLLKKHGLK